MEKIFFISAFVVVTFCSKESQEHCHDLECPDYEVTKYEGYEVHSYPVTSWIRTQIDGTKDSDVFAANERLKKYCEKHEAGERIKKAWPVLITHSEGEYWLSWFLPPGVSAPNDDVYSVSVKNISEGKYCVRSFDGVPSIKKGEENEKILRQICLGAEDDSSWAGYDSYFSLTHYNEVWIKV